MKGLERRGSPPLWAHPLPRFILGPAVLLSTLLLVCCGEAPLPSRALSPEAETAARTVERAYVEGWEANDPDAVMATLAPEAVIVPDGMRPIRGDSAIRAYWWPPDGSETRVTSYATTVQEIDGTGGFAYLRGTGELEFDWRAAGDEAWRSFTSRSVWTSILRRQGDGSWRMVQRMWHPVDDG